MYKLKLKVSYAEKELKFEDFSQVQDFLRYLVDGSDEAIDVEIRREEASINE